MRQNYLSFRTIPFLIAALLLAAVCAQAKTRSSGGGCCATAGLIRAWEAGRLPPPEIEKRFRPYLEEAIAERDGRRGGGRVSTAARAARPTQKDFLELLKVWDSLSPRFRALYNEAANIPTGLRQTYVSPAGKFKIYYTTDATSFNRVDLADTIGYGAAGAASWRQRSSGGNGVPDYIDEIAFALDSAWAMQVDRFGFNRPLPDSGSLYRVGVRSMADYGMTYPILPRAAAGFTSTIHINSDWSDWDDLGYDKRPYDAARVTCAHEFLHAIQYAMALSINYDYPIDDYPLAWVEGSAVLMEELAFPDVNDYLQYITGYFDSPRLTPFLIDEPNIRGLEYRNSILFKYLYEKTGPGDSIGFVKAAAFNKFNDRQLEFQRNLERVSQSYGGRPWAEILNGFHAESYFTGSRARGGMFVTDAGIMGMWPVPDRERADRETVKAVRANSAEFFRYVWQHSQPDTLYINIKCNITAAANGATWAASAIVTETAGGARIVKIPVSANGYGSAAIENWNPQSECLVVVTNAAGENASAPRNVTVTPAADAVIPPSGNNKITVAPNRVNLKSTNQAVRIYGGDITEVKILSPEGRVMGYYNESAAATESGSKSTIKLSKSGGDIIWHPDKRLVPGVYYVFAKSALSSNKGNGTHKRKVIILP